MSLGVFVFPTNPIAKDRYNYSDYGGRGITVWFPTNPIAKDRYNFWCIYPKPTLTPFPTNPIAKDRYNKVSSNPNY